MHSKDVQRLFDDKSTGWSRKYDPGGDLVERLRLFVQTVSLGKAVPADILDLGCGTGVLARALARKGYRVTASDISVGMLTQAAAEGPVDQISWIELQANWERLPFEDASFDCVVASSVLEYVEDPILVLREVARVLRSGGLMAFTVPDPASLVRRTELLLIPLASSRIGGYLMRISKPAGSYFTYLRLSRNRHPLDWWRSRAFSAGLAPSSGLEAATRRAGDVRRKPLALITAERRS